MFVLGGTGVLHASPDAQNVLEWLVCAVTEGDA